MLIEGFKKFTSDSLIMASDSSKKTEELYRKAIEDSALYGRKIQTMPAIPITGMESFSTLYTPGVAGVSMEIARDRGKSFYLTGRGNTIAIVSDGTRVLGLGNIGPEGALPVMEGKAQLFKYLGGVDAYPLCIGKKDDKEKSAEEIINFCRQIEPSVGGINLEDIESPKCFHVLEELQNLDIPVWHDDQQGTAGAILAGLINALKLTERKTEDAEIVIVGAGASNIATARVLELYGAPPKHMTVVDTTGTLYADRQDMEELKIENHWKYDLAQKTNGRNIVGGAECALDGADVVIAASAPGAVKKEWIKKMNDDPIVFSLANPEPEIWPEEAREAGAKIIATGRGDFPNQVNNSIIFPGVFRGVLDARSKSVTDRMVVSAAEAVAKYAERKGINENYIVPTMLELEFHPEVAASVATTAVSMGVARNALSYDEFYSIAKAIIDDNSAAIEFMTKNGYIKPMPRKI